MKVEPKVLGAAVRCKEETRKSALALLLSIVIDTMEPREKDKRQLGDRDIVQGHSVKQDPYSVQKAVEILLLGLDARLMNNQ